MKQNLLCVGLMWDPPGLPSALWAGGWV